MTFAVRAYAFIAWGGDQVAGGALNDMGGAGRAALRNNRARELGHAGLKLRVDAQNPTGAPRLYESVGFTRAFTYVTYQKTI